MRYRRKALKLNGKEIFDFHYYQEYILSLGNQELRSVRHTFFVLSSLFGEN